MRTVPCMGGWCTQRSHCAHYLAASPDTPAEDGRLCPPGRDGEREGSPVQIHRPAGTWETPHAEALRRADVFPIELLLH